jgi:ATP-dependent exoDNAse (exonuclease V) alpha subunit
LDTLIIDEVSMVRADLMDAIDQFMRINGKDENKPFGGVQMLFFGDIFQLQPVVASEEEQRYFASYYKSPYFFDAKIFNTLSYDILNLKKVFRQKDKEFIKLLDAVRLKSINNSQFSELNKRYIPDYWPSKDDKSITLTSTNKLAADMNEFRLNDIPNREFTFMGMIEGEFPKRSLPTEMLLRLKHGAQIMFVKNDFKKSWVNGTIGHICGIKDDFIEVEIIHNGEKYNYPVEKVEWEVLNYKYDYHYHKIITEVVGTFTQYPIKLAWAITIHKSQGLTFDNVIIDLGSGAFAHGQTYVALSRCTNFDGIILKKKINPSDIIVDYPVKRFYSSRFL